MTHRVYVGDVLVAQHKQKITQQDIQDICRYHGASLVKMRAYTKRGFWPWQERDITEYRFVKKSEGNGKKEI